MFLSPTQWTLFPVGRFKLRVLCKRDFDVHMHPEFFDVLLSFSIAPSQLHNNLFVAIVRIYGNDDTACTARGLHYRTPLFTQTEKQ